MKFGQLILRRFVKIVATKCQILRLKCTKIDFGWGSALLVREERYRKGGKGEREGRQGRGRRGGEGKGGRKGGEGTPVCIFKFSLE